MPRSLSLAMPRSLSLAWGVYYTLLSVVLVVVMIYMMRQHRRTVRKLNGEITVLQQQVKELTSTCGDVENR